MSYNIDHSEYVGKGKLTIKRADAIQLFQREDLPECTFLSELDLEGDPEKELVIEDPWFSGCGSGYGYGLDKNNVLVKLFSKTKGKAVILFVWEGGYSQTAIEVSGGKVKEKKVKISIED